MADTVSSWNGARVTEDTPDPAMAKRCIVVLGSGRSGTSILVQMLHAMGVQVSRELRATPSEHNVAGVWEDDEIIKKHQELSREFSARAYQPLPEGWEGVERTAQAVKEFRSIVRDRLEQTGANWVFKDPRTAVFLPLWLRVFNQEKIAPTYILALRDPKSVVASMMAQFAQDPTEGELMWLLRNAAAVTGTGGRLYTLHYESLLQDPVKAARDLSEYCRLDASEDAVSMAAALVNSSLDRSSVRPQKLQFTNTERLYESLKKCIGSYFDREALRVATEIETETRKYKSLFNAEEKTNRAKSSKYDTEAGKVNRAVERLNRDHEQVVSELAQVKVIASQQSAELTRLKRQKAQLKKDFEEHLSSEHALHSKQKAKLASIEVEWGNFQRIMQQLAVENTRRQKELTALQGSGRVLAESMRSAREAMEEIPRLREGIAKIADLKTKVYSTEKKADEFAAQQVVVTKALGVSIADLKANIQSVEMAFAQAFAEFRNYRDITAGGLKTVTALQTEVADLRRQLDSVKVASTETISEFRTHKDAIIGRLKEIENAFEAHRRSLWERVWSGIRPAG